MQKVLNKFVKKIKKQDYELDKEIKLKDIFILSINKTILLIRGTIRKQGFKIRGKNTFIGKKVKLKYKHYISTGNAVTIEDYVELNALSKNGIKLGDNVKIGSHTIISCTGSLENIGVGVDIGANSGVGDYCFFGAAGGIKIGNHVIMGQNVRFHSENHKFDRIDIPIKQQGVTNKGIKIDNDCWIGSGVVFLDGVTIGRGCVIGANTLVNKNIPPYSVAVGNPVKIVKDRRI
ncbi:acyltransferase [Priestia aryabhattai]|uniref:acyltransferase n=1 Tax=Priestia aryabhattai TaxID=412384 RepID=UPI002E22F457|nr:DapH/DapD/GlmU-related protein [Priestia aryabhattai]